MRWLVALLALAAPALADGIEEKDPKVAPKGKVLAWKNASLAYTYFVPKSYDPAKGAALTLVLHGSNLSRSWCFLNHKAGEWRGDDIVVCPDGTTPNGSGGFNFLQEDSDLAKLRTLHVELKTVFKVRATYLYGHSQGAFFSLLYAGAHPGEVQGAVAHAGGFWTGTQVSEQHHHQAIVLMHGTADSVVPYTNSTAALEEFEKRNYPLVRFRRLEAWEHKPAPLHSAQQLAYCEGMTSDDPARVLACLEEIAGAKEREWIDYAAAYRVAKRLEMMGEAQEPRKRRAAAVAQAVDKLAANHVAVFQKLLGKRDGQTLEDEAWVGYLPRFLVDFRGVPACDALRAEWADRLNAQAAASRPAFAAFWESRRRDSVKAFTSGVEALTRGFLCDGCLDREFLQTMKRFREGKMPPEPEQAYDKALPALLSSREKGQREYAGVNRKAGKL